MNKPKRRLSELIRAGCAIRPQGQFEFFTQDGKSCALGAAVEAELGPPGTVMINGAAVLVADWEEMKRIHPILNNRFDPPLQATLLFWGASPDAPFVACPFPRSTMAEIVGHLNDLCYWTREEIADFIETCELEHESEKFLATRNPAEELV